MGRNNRKTTLATSRFQAHDTRASHTLGKASSKRTRPRLPLGWHASLGPSFSPVPSILNPLLQGRTEESQLQALREVKGRLKSAVDGDKRESEELLLFLVNLLLDARLQPLQNAIAGVLSVLERGFIREAVCDTIEVPAWKTKLWEVIRVFARMGPASNANAQTQAKRDQMDLPYTMYALLKSACGFSVFVDNADVLFVFRMVRSELSRLADPFVSGQGSLPGSAAGFAGNNRSCKYLLDFLERYVDAEAVKEKIQRCLGENEEVKEELAALVGILRVWMLQEEEVVPKETVCCCANVFVMFVVLQPGHRAIHESPQGIASVVLQGVESDSGRLHLLRALVNYYPRETLFETPRDGQGCLMQRLLPMLLEPATSSKPLVRQVCYFALQSWFNAVHAAIESGSYSQGSQMGSLPKMKWIEEAVRDVGSDILTLTCHCSKREHHVLIQVLESVLRIAVKLPDRREVERLLSQVLSMVANDHDSGRIGMRRAAFPVIKLMIKMEVVSASDMLERQPALLDMLLDTIANVDNLSNTAALLFKQILFSMMEDTASSSQPNLWVNPVIKALTNTTSIGRTRIADTLLCPVLQQIPNASTLLLNSLDDAHQDMRWTKLKLLTSMRRSGAGLKLSKLDRGGTARVVPGPGGSKTKRKPGKLAKTMTVIVDPDWLYECFLHGDFAVSVEAFALITQSRKESLLPSADQLRLVKRMVCQWFKLSIPAQRNLVRAGLRRLITWVHVSTRSAMNTTSGQEDPDGSTDLFEAIGMITWLQQIACHQIYPGAPFDRIHLALELLWDVVTTFKGANEQVFLAPLLTNEDCPNVLIHAFLQSFDRGRILAYDILAALPTFPFDQQRFLRQALRLASGSRSRECDAGATMLRLLRLKQHTGVALQKGEATHDATTRSLTFIQMLVDQVSVSADYKRAETGSALERLELVAAAQRGVVGVLMALGYVWKDMELDRNKDLLTDVPRWRSLATDVLHRVLRICQETLELLGEDETGDGEGETSVDCRGHFVASEDDTAEGSNVAMLCWLTVREGCAVLAAVIKYSPLVGDAWVVSEDQVKQVTQWLLQCLLHLKHKGALEHATNAFQSCCHTLLRLQENDALGRIPSTLLGSLLEKLRHGSVREVHVLRRSAGFACSFLAIARAELSDGKAELLGRMVECLLTLGEGSRDEERPVETRVHCMNILAILAGDASLKYDMEPSFGSALQIAIRNLSAPQWNLRNASMNAFARIFQRLVGQNGIITGASFAKTYPALLQFLLHLIPSPDPATLFPTLLLLSRLSFPPEDPRPAGITPFVEPLKAALKHPHARIRALAAKTLVHFTRQQQWPQLAEELAKQVIKEQPSTGLNQIEGASRCLAMLSPLRMDETLAVALHTRLHSVERGLREHWGTLAGFASDVLWPVIAETGPVTDVVDSAKNGSLVAVRMCLEADASSLRTLLASEHSHVREEALRCCAGLHDSSKPKDEQLGASASTTEPAAVEVLHQLRETSSALSFLPERLARWKLQRDLLAVNATPQGPHDQKEEFERIADVATQGESYSLLSSGIVLLAEIQRANSVRFATLVVSGSDPSNIIDVRMACAVALQRSRLLEEAQGYPLELGWKAAVVLLQDEDYDVREETNKLISSALGMPGEVTFEPHLLQLATNEAIRVGRRSDGRDRDGDGREWGIPGLVAALNSCEAFSSEALFEPDEDNMYEEPLLRLELLAQLCFHEHTEAVAKVWRKELLEGLNVIRDAEGSDILGNASFHPDVFHALHKCILRSICPGTPLPDSFRSEIQRALDVCSVLHPIVRANLTHIASMNHALTKRDVVKLCFLVHVSAS